MRLTIVNLSSTIHVADFHRVVAAIRRQVKEDFVPVWPTLGADQVIRSLTHHLAGKAKIEGPHDAIIYLGDAAKDPTTGVEGALGYHSENHAGVPYGFVYIDICKEYGEEWTVTLSHEVLELLGDPDVSTTMLGPNPRHPGQKAEFDVEVCDPVQGDTYDLNGVEVSNFVTPAYFGVDHEGNAVTNHLGLPLAPFGVRPGGYFQYSDSSGTHQVLGKAAEEHAERRAAARALLGLGRRNTRRNAARAAKAAV